ncbi:MAG: hypothetical protein K2H64_04070 [Desulfovibrio sp.]|nr:hypothetical protein [Desulfovibrio sp.]
MGQVLQIRVIAVTWNDDLVEEEWPRISRLAFSVPVKLENHGVLEMVRALAEGLKFMDWPARQKEALAPGIEKAAKIRRDLEKALPDWEPARANELSDRLEDALDELERAFVN